MQLGFEAFGNFNHLGLGFNCRGISNCRVSFDLATLGVLFVMIATNLYSYRGTPFQEFFFISFVG